MMVMMMNGRRINVAWGCGCSDLFLDLTGEEPRILDFEYDWKELHERCGGKTYYVSCSGDSGAGYLEHLGELIPIGTYRVDTTWNEFQNFASVGKFFRDEYGEGGVDVMVAVPYRSHTEDKKDVLLEHPTVIKVKDGNVNILVYCDFYHNSRVVLRDVLSGRLQRHRTLKRSFTRIDEWGNPEEKEVSIQFYDFCHCPAAGFPNPWEFFQEELAAFRAGGTERLFHLLGVEKLRNGTFVKTAKIAGSKYRGKVLFGDPLTGELTAGWQRLADDVLVRFYDGSNEVHLVAYAPAAEAHRNLAQRLAHRIGEGEEFISIASVCDSEYVEYEVTVPKVLYALDKANYLAEVRNGMARKVRQDVAYHVRERINDVNDKTILETIPDELMVTFEDSLAAGNCRPGSQDFVDRYFPGKTETTAAELKKFANNYNVMRIFRYLAAIGRFDCKVKTLSV